MVRIISKVALAAVCMLALAVFTQQAKASGADFGCSGTTSCNGTVTVSGGNFSSTSITTTAGSFDIPGLDTNDSEVGETFILAFDTGAKTISLSDTDAATESTPFSTDLTGTITAFNCINTLTLGACNPGDASDTVQLAVNWNISGFHAGGGFVTFLLKQGNAVNSVDISVLPTPEPASLLLLGSGLLGMGAAVRRRLL